MATLTPEQRTEHERRENLFRELDKAPWSGRQVIVLMAVGLIGFGMLTSGDIAATFLGLLVLAGLVMFVVRRWKGELPAITPAEIEAEVELRAADVRTEALDRLKLDEEDDVIQSLVLFGGILRPFIEGRIRSVTGPKPNPNKLWVPWVPVPEVKRYCFGRYQIHVLFALRDAIAFHTRHYDVIDHEYAGAGTAMETGSSTSKIYYRTIENVRMTNFSMELQMVSGRTHVFPISVRPEDQGGGAQARADVARTQDVAWVNEMMLRAGEDFEHAVNQLRDEWEQRQATH